VNAVKETKIQFIKNRRWAYLFSFVLFVSFVTVAYVRGGMNWGIDFAGGVKVTAQFDKGVDASHIRDALDKANIPNSVQQISASAGDKSQFIISTKLAKGDKIGDKTFPLVRDALLKDFSNVQILSNESVGPAIGDYLRNAAWKMILLCVLMMTIYLAFRFEFRFSAGAMIALVHDVVLSVALAAACRVEFDIPVLAAILTIFGYSVNDTIVIFDRIRERMHSGSNLPFADLMNSAINQTLSRTIITVLCTLFATVSLLFLGGEVIHGFALVLTFGIIIGCYSSIFIASPVVLAWESIVKPDEDETPKKK
jgi:preprotein translocase subunit SecF